MSNYLLSIASIICGIISILIPIFSIVKRKPVKKTSSLGNMSHLISATLCAVSICVQIWGIKESILLKNDYSSVHDTINVLSLICTVLICLVFCLNTISIIVKQRKG